MKRWFLDLGAHKGESVTLFRRDYPNASEFSIVSFEPNVDVHKYFTLGDIKDVEFNSVAVWTENTTLTFHRHQYSVGYSVYDTHPKSFKQQGEFQVPAIDFSAWLKAKVSPDDYVILKMDIEGAEYKVLQKMLDDGTIDLVSKLYIEFHDHWMVLEEGEHDRLVADLRAKGLTPYNWCATHNKAFIESPESER